MSVQGLGNALVPLARELVSDVAVQLVGQAVRLAPELVDIIRRGLAGASSSTPLVAQLEAILPAEGASARAARELRR